MILNPWKKIRQAEAANAQLVNLMIQKSNLIDDLTMEVYELRDRLDAIVAQEKPTSNSTVKRMANIARMGVAK
jgi:hypothetical protein